MTSAGKWAVLQGCFRRPQEVSGWQSLLAVSQLRSQKSARDFGSGGALHLGCWEATYLVTWSLLVRCHRLEKQWAAPNLPALQHTEVGVREDRGVVGASASRTGPCCPACDPHYPRFLLEEAPVDCYIYLPPNAGTTAFSLYLEVVAPHWWHFPRKAAAQLLRVLRHWTLARYIPQSPLHPHLLHSGPG